MTKRCEEKAYTLGAEEVKKEYDRILFVQPVMDLERALFPLLFERSSKDNSVYIFVKTFISLWAILNMLEIPKSFGGSRISF